MVKTSNQQLRKEKKKHHGFVRVAAGTPKIRLADVKHNIGSITELISWAEEYNAKVLVLPELCLTGYTCGDLFTHETLLKEAEKGLNTIAESTKYKDVLVFIGLPLAVEGKIYNVVATLSHGKVLGFTSKTTLSNCYGLDEKRYFSPGPKSPIAIQYNQQKIPFGSGLLFQAASMKELIVVAEIGDELYAPTPMSTKATMEGAILIANCSANDESIGWEVRRRETIQNQSSRLLVATINSNAGEGESNTDRVFGGGSFIVEEGDILKEGNKYQSGIIYTEIDIWKLTSERRRTPLYQMTKKRTLPIIPFETKLEEVKLSRKFWHNPFVPQSKRKRSSLCEEVLMIQAMGLKQRIEQTGVQTVVIGISGGLDSTLALLVVARAFALLGKAKKDMIAVTMPGFGTTERTRKNATLLAKKLGATLKIVPIDNAVNLHFSDIGHDPNRQDEVYERAQARERNQILLDIAAGNKGLVVGTIDMSELALGWLTFGGDSVAMYGVNVSVPKTLVRFLVQFFAEHISDEELRLTLQDILMTPISSELLPPEEGKASLRTERMIGPYELNDFFLYYTLRYRFSPEKIFFLAVNAFRDKHSARAIGEWMKVFYKRFYTQQYKRNNMPEGPKVGKVSLSPRGDLQMPSDVSPRLWLDTVEEFIEIPDEQEWLSDLETVSVG